MGRLKKYTTPESKAEAKRLKAKEYYWNNKEKCDEKSRKRYKRNKKDL